MSRLSRADTYVAFEHDLKQKKDCEFRTEALVAERATEAPKHGLERAGASNEALLLAVVRGKHDGHALKIAATRVSRDIEAMAPVAAFPNVDQRTGMNVVGLGVDKRLVARNGGGLRNCENTANAETLDLGESVVHCLNTSF